MTTNWYEVELNSVMIRKARRCNSTVQFDRPIVIKKSDNQYRRANGNPEIRIRKE